LPIIKRKINRSGSSRWSEFREGQSRAEDHRENAYHRLAGNLFILADEVYFLAGLKDFTISLNTGPFLSISKRANIFKDYFILN